MITFYFTATGNSLYVAKSIGGRTYSIPSLLKNDNLQFEDDSIGLVFPCYVGSVPTLVEEFLEKATFKTDYFFGIMTYGNKGIAGTDEFIKIASKNGVELSYVNSIKMVDTSLKYYDMAKQIENQHKKQVDKHLNQIIKDIKDKKHFIESHNALLRMLSSFGRKSYRREIGNADEKFKVESHCNGCQCCVKVCPVNNISFSDKIEFNHNCIRCYACTQNCPQNAIRFHGEKSKARFRNENVTLKEIIKSNNQTSQSD